MSTFDQDNRPLILEAGRADRQYWLDLWRYRELFFILAWRDVAVRYKQTVIGVVWAFMRPFLTMVVFTVVFGSLAKLPSEGSAPYAIMVFAGLLPWTLFASVLSEASVERDRQRQPDHQGLLPASDRAAVDGRGRADRFPGKSHDPGRPDALVRRGARLADPAAAGLRRCWRCWRRSVRRSGRPR